MGIHDRDWYHDEYRKKAPKIKRSDPLDVRYRPKEFRKGRAGTAHVAAKEVKPVTMKRSLALYYMLASIAISSAVTFFTTLLLLAVKPELLSEPYLLIVRYAAG